MNTTNGPVVASCVAPEVASITIPKAERPELLQKPGGCTVFWAQWSMVQRVVHRTKWQTPPLFILPFMSALLFALNVSFVWFQLDYSPSSAPSFFRVFTFQTLYFTGTSHLGAFTAFRADRKERLPCATGPGVGQHLSPLSVWFGRYLPEMPFRILYTIIVSALIYPIVGLRPGFQYYLLYQTGFILQTIANGAFGMLMSAIFRDPILGVWGAIFINEYNYIFSGVAYTASRITWIIKWMRYLSVSYYVDQILIWSQFKGATYPDSDITGDDILNQTGWLTAPIYISIPGLILLFILFNILGPLCLHLSSRPGKLK